MVRLLYGAIFIVRFSLRDCTILERFRVCECVRVCSFIGRNAVGDTAHLGWATQRLVVRCQGTKCC